MLLPEGDLIIAQRFNAGLAASGYASPDGTAEREIEFVAPISAVPSGRRPWLNLRTALALCLQTFPAIKS